MSADDTSEPSMVFRPGLQTPIPVEGRHFHDLGVWASALQPGDDAAFELVGRIVSEFGKIEFDLGELSLDLAHAGFLSKANNVQKRFPGTISKKISFIRFCFDVEGPVSPYRRGGHRFLDRLKMQFDFERIRYAHSAIELNLMHSQDGIARFSFQIIREFEKNIRQDGGMLNERRVLSVYEILDDYKKIRLSAAIVRRFRNYMRLRKGLKDAPSEIYPPLDLEE